MSARGNGREHTWSKPAQIPFARAHLSNSRFAIATGRMASSKEKRIEGIIAGLADSMKDAKPHAKLHGRVH